jgi:hypothetical protein
MNALIDCARDVVETRMRADVAKSHVKNALHALPAPVPREQQPVQVRTTDTVTVAARTARRLARARAPRDAEVRAVVPRL